MEQSERIGSIGSAGVVATARLFLARLVEFLLGKRHQLLAFRISDTVYQFIAGACCLRKTG
jgi:hypothetical protein